MKTFGYLLLSIAIIGFSGSAVAKSPKNDIMHCGCVYVAEDETTGTASMEWKQLSIKNGNGHRNHVVDQLDDCLSGYDPILCTEEDVGVVEGCTSTDDIKGYDPLYTTFVRDFDDCLVDGNLNFLELCDDPEDDFDVPPVEGDDCGFELVE